MDYVDQYGKFTRRGVYVFLQLNSGTLLRVDSYPWSLVGTGERVTVKGETESGVIKVEEISPTQVSSLLDHAINRFVTQPCDNVDLAENEKWGMSVKDLFEVSREISSVIAKLWLDVVHVWRHPHVFRIAKMRKLFGNRGSAISWALLISTLSTTSLLSKLPAFPLLNLL